MLLPYLTKYEDPSVYDAGLETRTARELPDEKPDKSLIEEIEETLDEMCERSFAQYAEDEGWNTLILDHEVFSDTFFDDIRELEVGGSYGSSVAEREPPRQGRWSGPPIHRNVLIRSHDCMWTGICNSLEHKDGCCDKALQNLWALQHPPRVPNTTNSAQSSQQSLLKPSLRNAGLPIINLITPQTPPMSDDEDKYCYSTLRLEHGVDSSDVDEAAQDLIEYFEGTHPDNFGRQLRVKEEKEDEEEEDGNSEESSEESESESDEEESHNRAGPSRVSSNVTSVMSNIHATQNDHSYFKEKNSSMIMSDLGIDTPSDSEEEIDVVSVPDKKYPVAGRMGYIPPTNPPMRGRRNIQRNMDSSMVNGHLNNNNNTNNRNGVKIILPTKRAPSAINYPPAKRRAVAAPANENQKGRRPRQTRNNMSTVRRRANNSQDHPGPSDLGRRDIHNNMERQRREDLRDAFDDLRRLVPEVLRKDRAAKVVILREAAKYCNYLTNLDLSMKQHKRDLKVHQKKLKRRVSYLRTQAAIESGRIAEDGDNEEDEDYEEDCEEEEEDDEYEMDEE